MRLLGRIAIEAVFQEFDYSCERTGIEAVAAIGVAWRAIQIEVKVRCQKRRRELRKEWAAGE
jgi:hypothetical protein